MKNQRSLKVIKINNVDSQECTSGESLSMHNENGEKSHNYSIKNVSAPMKRES